MLLVPQGHSQFLLEDRHGQRLVTDPYDAHTGYPMEKVRADVVTVSHAHGDHSFTEKITGSPIVIREAGVHMPLPDVRVTGIPSFHDEVRGEKRGSNLLMLIEMDGLRTLHCGDLGHLPDSAILAAAGRVDLLLIPVGGFFTIDAEAAMEACRLFRPRVILPMHFRTGYNASWPIRDAAPFLELCTRQGLQYEEAEILRVTPEDLDLQPAVCVLRYAKEKA